MEMRIKEAIRYLGYGRHAVDDGTFALITEVFRELDQIKCANQSIAFLICRSKERIR